MAQKWLIGLTIVAIVLGMFIVCRMAENSQKSQWEQRSENLLKVKKHPKKPLTKKNLFE